MPPKKLNTTERISRTSLIIDHEVKEKAAKVAEALGMSFDTLVREILHHHITHTQSPKPN